MLVYWCKRSQVSWGRRKLLNLKVFFSPCHVVLRVIQVFFIKVFFFFKGKLIHFLSNNIFSPIADRYCDNRSVVGCPVVGIFLCSHGESPINNLL